ncbi:PQQ-dependent sugar dehydrogenase [Pontimicrobium aquaticum]|uniref:T9SS type A sorting domain-containing protein n=1 Tax=Pontimicrobium aquaticum TaxID=2565367 RepID=A0A4V6WEA8_9FLAO|nr:PQQ-dependent sugar dehydrogenase [Pontimicrobium aquaticum]TJY35859.1 T9SS type A sorting domain-containing protein [Pontimicrobium aquaticum]
MKQKLLLLLICIGQSINSQTPVTSGPDWTVTNLTSNQELNYPNTIVYMPDNTLWITERIGKKVVKVSTAGGSKTEMLDLTGQVHQSVSQDGLLGMTVHPDLYADMNTSTNNYVYLVYTYDDDPGPGLSRKFRVARYTYNSGTGTLNSGSATTIIDDIAAGNDHNSGKIKIGPDLKLYWTIGEHGNNRSGNACEEIRSQYLPTSDTDHSDYQGKILRLNLDGSIPADNPTLDGVKSHVYTYGHRNAQGIVFGSNGILYSSEHGDKTDDELNIITAGKNYGWPLIAGYNDDSAYAYCNWSSYPANCGSYDANSCPGAYIDESTSAATMTDFQPPIGTYNSTVATEPTGGWLTWPTVAPSSINIYEGGKIPGWGTSLFIPTLKAGMILRTKLNAAGTALEDGTYEEFHSGSERFRDVIMDPDGVTLYAITDNNKGTSRGVIMKFTYSGTVLSNPKQNLNTFSLTPNPASSHIKLTFGTNAAYNSVTVQIIDLQGKVLMKNTHLTHNSTLNISNLSNGLYFVKVLDNNDKELKTKKLIVK